MSLSPSNSYSGAKHRPVRWCTALDPPLGSPYTAQGQLDARYCIA